MPEFTRMGKRFKERFKIDGTNNYIMGQILPVPENAGRGATTFFTPRRVLEVNPEANLATGTVLIDRAGRRLLTAWAGADSNQSGEYSQVFKLFDLDTQFNWLRSGTTTDAVTGLNKSNQQISLGTFWGCLELFGPDLTSLTAMSRYRVLTPAHLKLSDTISNPTTGRHYAVRRCETALGVYIAEVA